MITQNSDTTQVTYIHQVSGCVCLDNDSFSTAGVHLVRNGALWFPVSIKNILVSDMTVRSVFLSEM